MSHIPITVVAYLLNGVGVLIDKALLTNHIKNPLTMIFYMSAFSALALLAVPFLPVPSFLVFVLASASTIIWTSGLYFYLHATKIGQPSRVVPIIGSLIPIFLIVYYGFVDREITQTQMIAALILVLGMGSLALSGLKGHWSSKEIVFEIISAFLFAISYIILKEAYTLGDNFLMVLVWSRTILIPVGLVILVIPALKRIALVKDNQTINFRSRVGALFLVGQGAGGISELLLTYSISLANPALVNSLQGTQYVFLFIANIFLSKKYPKIFEEKLNLVNVTSKIIGIALIGIGLYLLA